MDLSPIPVNPKKKLLKLKRRKSRDRDRKDQKDRKDKKHKKHREKSPKCTDRVRPRLRQLGGMTENRLILPKIENKIDNAGLFNQGKKSGWVTRHTKLSRARCRGNILDMLQGPSPCSSPSPDLDENKENIPPDVQIIQNRKKTKK